MAFKITIRHTPHVHFGHHFVLCDSWVVSLPMLLTYADISDSDASGIPTSVVLRRW